MGESITGIITGDRSPLPARAPPPPPRRPETGKALFSAAGDVLELARGLGAGPRVPTGERSERLAGAFAAAVARVRGDARDVGRPRWLSAAVDELAGRLDRQLVVWLEGRLLPTEIALTAEGRSNVRFPGPATTAPPS